MKMLEILDLYKLHSNPETLKGHAVAYEKSPKLAWEKFKGDRKELDKRKHVWASDPLYAYYYARDVINGRFPEGEKILASNAFHAYNYARIINGRFPEGEKAIASNPEIAYYYARDIIRGRFPEGEEAIASDPELAYWYAHDVIYGRFPEGEEAIASNRRYAKLYMKLLKGIK